MAKLTMAEEDGARLCVEFPLQLPLILSALVPDRLLLCTVRDSGGNVLEIFLSRLVFCFSSW